MRALEDLGWEEDDVLAQIDELEVDDFERVERSTVHPGDRVWVFCPDDAFAGRLWIRLVERGGVILISFHRA